MKLCPETFPVIQGHEPAAANAIVDTSDWICLKNCAGVPITVHHYSGGGDTDMVRTVHEGRDWSRFFSPRGYIPKFG